MKKSGKGATLITVERNHFKGLVNALKDCVESLNNNHVWDQSLYRTYKAILTKAEKYLELKEARE